MYNYIDEVPQEVQDRADEFFKEDPCNISDCGGHDIPKKEYETMENIYSDETTEDLPF